MESEYVHAMFNLLIILILLLSFFILIKKFKLSKFNGKKIINLLQVVSIGSKEKLILIEANKSYILLGATANRIETLHVFDHLETEGMSTEKGKEENDFATSLKQLNQ